MGLLDDELAKIKRAFGLLGDIKLKNDPAVKKMDEFERNLYEKSLIYQSMKDAFTAPARAMRGELDPLGDPRGTMAEAMNLAGMAQLGGIPGGARGPGSVGMTVWHGSPHKFDKFDMSKIGTGEGAQAYGHGLYMAEMPEVAQTYKATAPYVGRHVQQIGLDALKNADGDVTQARKILAEQYASNKDPYLRQPLADAMNNIQDIAKWNVGGNLYKVDIPDEAVSRMLDWDKPLSEQAPEVREAVANGMRGFGRSQANIDDVLANMNGQQALQYLMPSGNRAQASEVLAKHNILGIRYLDGGSRAAGEGTSNFVLFDDQLPRILERNGVPTGLQPWAPGEANGLLGLPPAAPMRPANPIGNGKKTFVKDSAHAQTIADNIYNLANASGLEVAFEKSPAWGSQYLTITHPDGRVLRVRVADHANRYGGNDVYIDPSSASVEEGISAIRNAFPELLNKMPAGQSKKFFSERAKAMQDAEMFMLKNAKGTKPAELYPLVNKIGEAKSRAEIVRLRNELEGLVSVSQVNPIWAQAK